MADKNYVVFEIKDGSFTVCSEGHANARSAGRAAATGACKEGAIYQMGCLIGNSFTVAKKEVEPRFEIHWPSLED